MTEQGQTLVPISKSNIDYQVQYNILYKTRTWLYDRDPFTNGVNYSDVPYFVVSKPKIAEVIEKRSGAASRKNYKFSVTITLRAAKKGSSGYKELDGMDDLNTLMAALRETFNNPEVNNLMMRNGMSAPELELEDNDEIELENKDIYEAKYSLLFEPRLVVY